MYVVDASAIFSGHIPNSPFMITSEVYNEIRDTDSKNIIDSYISSGKVTIIQPSPSSLSIVNECTFATGETLSLADISSLSLAFEKGATIATDDYGIQNIAKKLDISYISAKSKGIQKIFQWTWKCIGCNTQYDFPKEKVCDICGSPLKRVRKKRR